jgi:hypothetical protein
MTYHITAQGASAIPLPAGAWTGLATLTLAALPRAAMLRKAAAACA